jgi:hypothetical protein
VHREHGGGHDPQNIILTRGAHHTAHHEGRLLLSGTSDNLIVEYPNRPKPIRAHVGADLGVTIAQTQAEEALIHAVADAAKEVPADATLQALVVAALRRCPSSSSPA